MQVRRVGASTGWRWVVGGFRLLASRPLPLLALIIFYLFMLVMPSVLPVVGAIVPTLLTPVFAVGLMVAMRAADRGEQPHPRMLFAAFGTEGGRAWRRLLLIGAISAAATLVAVGLTSVLDGGALLSIATAPVDDASSAASDAGEATLIPSLALFLVLLIPIQAAAWYAPLFVAWHRVPVVQSMFFSLVAVWRNKGAFVVFVASWIAVALSVSTAVQLVRAALGEAAPLLSMVFFAVSIAMLAAIYGSIWLSYRDVIDDPGPPADAAGVGS